MTEEQAVEILLDLKVPHEAQEAIEIALDALKRRMFTNLYIRDKYSGSVHRVGDNVHDMLYVDDEGTVHYCNMQNGDGCVGYKSVNRETLAQRYPDTDWKSRREELVYGYEFVPNLNEYGAPVNPMEVE